MTAEKLPAYRQPLAPTLYKAPEQGAQKHSFFIDQFIDFFSTRLKASSESIGDYIELANLFRQKRKYKRAFMIHRDLLARPTITKLQKTLVYAEMGYDYLYSRTKDCGEHYFATSLKIDKKNPYALEGLYQAYRQQKKFSQALDILKKLLRFSPDKHNEFNVLYSEMVMTCIHQQDLTNAKRWHKKATQYGHTAFLDLMHVQLLLAEKKTEKAISHLTDMIMQYAQHASFLIHKLEDLLFESNQYDQYFLILTRCHQKMPTHPYVNHALAKYFEKTSQLEKAKQFYLLANESHPSNLQFFKDSATFFHKHNDQSTMPTIEKFLQSITTEKTYACQSCNITFDEIPKNCKTCKGWNLFDIQYTIKHQ